MNKEQLNTKHSSFLGFLVAFIGSILFSTKAIIVKKAFADEQVDALTLLMIRMLFSLPFYLVTAVYIFRQSSNVRMTSKDWVITIGLGLFGYYLSSLLDFIGLQYISAGLERLILFLYPSFVVLINAFVFGQKITGIQKLALLLSYTGIGIAYFGELKFDTSNPNFYLGSFMVFLCSITYAIYIAGSGKMVPKIGPGKFTTYALLTSTAAVFGHYAIRGEFHAFQESMDLWWYGVLLAVVATVLPTFMLAFSMKKIGSSSVAIISSIGPVSTILQAHYILGERIFLEQIIGTILVLIGVLLLAVKFQK